MNMDIETLKVLLQNGMLSQEDFYKIVNERYLSEKGILKTNHGQHEIHLTEIVKEFEREIAKELSPTSVKAYVNNVKRFIYTVLDLNSFKELEEKENKGEYIKYTEFPEFVVTNFFEKLARDGYNHNSIRRYKFSLKKYFDFVNERYNLPVPILEVNDAMVYDLDFDVLHDDAIQQMIEHSDSPRGKAMVCLMYYGTMKRNEIIEAKISDLNYEKSSVQIYKQDQLDRVALLEDWVMRTIKQYVSSSERPDNDQGYIFATKRSQQVSYATVNRELQKMVLDYYSSILDEEATKDIVKKVTTETLRKSRRAYLLALGKTIEQVQMAMGDENKHSVRRYQKVAQVIYPEMF